MATISSGRTEAGLARRTGDLSSPFRIFNRSLTVSRVGTIMSLTGRTISNFEILEKLGSGGMGVVYLARDTVLNRPAALKFLPPHLATDEDAKARFVQEAQAASALDHPNICSIYQIGETPDGELFIAMAHYEGQTLKYRLQEEEFSVERTMDIGSQLAAGLLRAHEAGIVHRDIKPANIMVTDRGEVKILDFGLAKLATGAQLTKSGSTLGTAAYMSPEQYRGETVGPGADIWSLGVVLYEMVSGTAPFQGDYEQAVMYSVLNSQPTPMAEANPNVPDELAQFIAGCLEKDPAARPSLDHFPGAGSAVREQHVAEPAEGSPISWHRAGLVVAGTILLAAAALVWFLRPGSSQEAGLARADLDGPTRVAVLPFTVRGNPEFAYLGQGMVDILATKLDGAGNWRSVDPRAILGSLGDDASVIDPAAGEEVASKVDAGRFILGSIVEASGTLQVRASVYDPSKGREPIAGGSAEGPADQLFSLVDELAAQLLVAEDATPGDRVTRLAAVTTESLPALKSYLEGESDFRAGKYRDALDAFRHAVELDSTFALAWYRLSVAAEWNAQGRIAKEASAQARKLTGRLSGHDRDLLEAFDMFRRGNAARAEEMYRSILAVYPEDVEAWFQLGEILAHQMPLQGRSSSDSREAWERILYYEPDHLQALWHLYRISAMEGKLAELDSLVSRIVAINPDGDRLVEVLALQASAHRDPAMMQEVFRRMEMVSEGSAALAASFVPSVSRHPQDAEALMLYMVRPGVSREQRVLGYEWLSYLTAGFGRMSDAERHMAEALRVSRDRALPYHAFLVALPFLPLDAERADTVIRELTAWDASSVANSRSPQSWHIAHDNFHQNLKTYLVGLLSAMRGDVERAEASADEFDRLETPETLGTVGDDLGLSLRAQIMLARGDTTEALGLLLQQKGHLWYNIVFGSPFVSLVRDRFMKGELLRAAGQMEEALRFYRSIEETGPFDAVLRAPALRRQAEIYDEMERTEEATAYYRRFLDLWENADPELQPEVQAARERLAELEAGV